MFWEDMLCATWMDDWKYSERSFVVVVAAFCHGFFLWGFDGFFLLLDRGWCGSGWRRYKIPRKKKFMNPALKENVDRDRKAINEQIVGTFVVVPLVVYLAYPLLKMRGMTVCDGDSPRAAKICLNVLFQMLICDCLFYWSHRLLHAVPWLYRNVHKQHHEYKGTNVWASEYFSPADMLLQIIPGVVPAVILNVDFFSLMVFTTIREWQTVQSHAGYDLPCDPLNRFIFSGGARRHDFHHTHNTGCYGDWMPFWDYVCGTDREYREYWKTARAEEKRKA